MNSEIISLLQKAIQEIQTNQFDSAKLILQQVLGRVKDQPDALRFLGVIAALQKDWVEALRLIDCVIKITPDNGVAHSNRGNILNELRRHEEALACYERAIGLEPKYAEVYSNKGNVLQTLGNYDEALASYEAAILIDKTCAPAFYGAALIFQLRKKYDYAMGCCDQALKINSQYEVAHFLRGSILFQVKDYRNALSAYDQVLLINPQSSDALVSKSDIYAEMKQFEKSAQALDEALAIEPDKDFLLGSLIQNTIQMCNWANYDKLIIELIAKVKNDQKAAIPYNFISLLDDRHLIKNAIEIYAKSLQSEITRAKQAKQPKKEKIRLGYFSADFHNHPTAYLIAELFECHDKEKFELIAFVFGRNSPDEMRQRLENAFDQFLDVSDKTDEEVSQIVREMEIDIAIDLKGFTKEARPKIFMYGAAPIQVSYLAFPGTMGLTCFDYVIADPILIPEKYQDGMVEKIIYMPNSYQVNDRNRRISPIIKSRKELGLPESGFVFCCFNNNYKITPTVLDGWVKILQSVEGSVLWLYEDNPFAVVNLRKEALARGLDTERLIFAARMEPAEHLARYKNADLFLDTTPCNAHTTASDALWAGLPVLTMAGESFGARVAASLNHAVGLSDLIVENQEDYEALAIKLATSPKLLREIKSRLKANLITAPLFNTPLFTRNLEDAFMQVYRLHQMDKSPEHIYINHV